MLLQDQIVHQWKLHKIIISVCFDRHEFFYPFPNQLICYFIKGMTTFTKSSEEIQKLTVPEGSSLTETLAHILSKGLPSQWAYVKHLL